MVVYTGIFVFRIIVPTSEWLVDVSSVQLTAGRGQEPQEERKEPTMEVLVIRAPVEGLRPAGVHHGKPAFFLKLVHATPRALDKN